jgi:hypothetical protein
MASSVRTPPSSPPRLLTVRQFAEQHQAFSEAGLRWLIFCASPRSQRVNGVAELTAGNGLAVALVRIGRRVLIDEERFFRWARGQGGEETGGGAKPRPARAPALPAARRQDRAPRAVGLLRRRR